MRHGTRDTDQTRDIPDVFSRHREQVVVGRIVMTVMNIVRTAATAQALTGPSSLLSAFCRLFQFPQLSSRLDIFSIIPFFR